MPFKDPEVARQYWQAYRANPANKEKQRRWKEARHARMQNGEWRDHYYDANLRRLYGITLEQYQDMFNAQGGCCAICGTPQSVEKKRLSVDHCHTTGVVRGLLCQHCNHAIGKFNDDPLLLRKAASYLESPRQRNQPVVTRIWGKAVRRVS